MIIYKTKKKNEVNFRLTVLSEMRDAMWRGYSSATPYEIADWLNNLGIKQNNGKKVTAGYIRLILSRLFYNGDVTVVNDFWKLNR